MEKRLDLIVTEKFGLSRTKAQALIMAGEVTVDGSLATKPGQEFTDDKNIELKEKFPYVSRGALKLEHAAKEFNIDFSGKVVCDVGASTGGFTDFALQNGAAKVYAIDTGKGQIAQQLREDKRVILMENTNIKEVGSLPEPIDIFVIDVSFISLKRVLPAIQNIIQKSKIVNRKSCDIIALIKPQFEVGKKVADKYKGVIKDKEIQVEVVKDIGEFSENLGFIVKDLTESPITGAKGNKEYLMLL